MKYDKKPTLRVALVSVLGIFLSLSAFSQESGNIKDLCNNASFVE